MYLLLSTVSNMWEIFNTWQLLMEVHYLQYKLYIKIGTSGDSYLTKAIVYYHLIFQLIFGYNS